MLNVSHFLPGHIFDRSVWSMHPIMVRSFMDSEIPKRVLNSHHLSYVCHDKTGWLRQDPDVLMAKSKLGHKIIKKNKYILLFCELYASNFYNTVVIPLR